MYYMGELCKKSFNSYLSVASKSGNAFLCHIMFPETPTSEKMKLWNKS